MKQSYSTQKFSILTCCKVAVVFLILIIMVSSFCSCPGVTDWSYSLPNGFEIVRCNYKTVHLQAPYYIENPEGGMTTLITGEKFVSKFAYNDVYIAVQCVELPDDIEYEDMEETINNADTSYGIVNSETREMYFDLTLDEYNELINTLSIENLSSWIGTLERPEGASE